MNVLSQALGAIAKAPFLRAGAAFIRAGAPFVVAGAPFVIAESLFVIASGLNVSPEAADAEVVAEALALAEGTVSEETLANGVREKSFKRHR